MLLSRMLINFVTITGSKEQSPEMRALQQKMLENLKKRKLDLEDRLYDKVQELKEVCRQEYVSTGCLD